MKKYLTPLFETVLYSYKDVLTDSNTESYNGKDNVDIYNPKKWDNDLF